MTDLEISKALALAIGWREDQVSVGYFSNDLPTICLRAPKYPHDGVYKHFDYRDWNVIGPIAARYDCFPMRGVTDALWHSCCVGNVATVNAYAETPQKAIAMAVIEGAKK